MNLTGLIKLPHRKWRGIALLILSLAFITAGTNHFLHPQSYVAIMPSYLPAHLELVYISGFFEVTGGAGVLIYQLRRWSGFGLIALSIAVFPANLHMALNSHEFADLAEAWFWFARLPLQLVIIGWIYWCCLAE